MRHDHRVLATLASLFLVAGGLLLGAGPAAAAPPTTCTGTSYGAPRTTPVDGDLIVPEGVKCFLRKTAVHGNVTVGRNGYFQGNNATVYGTIRVGPADTDVSGEDSGLELLFSTVQGDIDLDSSGGLDIIDGTVTGDIRGSIGDGSQATPGPSEHNRNLDLTSTRILGRMSIRGDGEGNGGTSALLSGSRVQKGAHLTHLYATSLDNTIDGYLVLEDAIPLPDGDFIHMPQVLCGTTVDGNLTITTAQSNVHLSNVDWCSRADTVNGSLLLSDNDAVVYVAGHITGDAVCRNNLHHPRNAHLPLTIDGDNSCPGLPSQYP